MTAIVGIRCSNGIVLAADGAATLGNQGFPTAQQRRIKKITCDERCAVAAAGHVGLGQRLTAALQRGIAEKHYTGALDQQVRMMRKELFQHVEFECQAAKVMRDISADASAMDGARTSLLLAHIVDDELALVHFDEKCAPTIISTDLMFQTTGMGQQFADPFLLFARRLLWNDALPDVATAVLSAVWTLTHAIDVNPGGISLPIQVVSVERGDGTLSLHEHSPEEVEEHLAAIGQLENAITGWKRSFNPPAIAGNRPPQ